jgi:hypothetical protein
MTENEKPGRPELLPMRVGCEGGLVMVTFSKPCCAVAWPPETAILVAEGILRRAKALLEQRLHDEEQAKEFTDELLKKAGFKPVSS